MRFAIHGYYGLGNLGDDLMLYVLLNEISKKYQDATFLIVLQPEGLSSQVYLPKNIPVNFAHINGLKDLFNIVRNSDIVVYGGGTCLLTGGFCGLYLNIASRLLFTTSKLIGIGASPITGFKSKYKAWVLLNFVSQVTVRDIKSLEQIKKITLFPSKVQLTEDLVYLYKGNITQQKKETKKYICLSWRNTNNVYSQDQNDQLKSTTIQLILWMCEKYNIEEIRIIDVSDEIDQFENDDLKTKLKKQLPSHISLEHKTNLGSEEKIQEILHSFFVISMRLHSYFLAKEFELPAMAIKYAPKIQYFCESINTPVMLDLVQHDKNIEYFENLCKQVQYEIDSPSLISNLEEKRHLSEQNINII